MDNRTQTNQHFEHDLLYGGRPNWTFVGPYHFTVVSDCGRRQLDENRQSIGASLDHGAESNLIK